jgi:hypothetical protein
MIRTLIPLLLISAVTPEARAQFDESAFRQALKVKRDVYLAEGAISGGDRLVSDVKVTNVRIAANPAGFDRVVVDFSKAERPPFFLVENDPSNRRVNITLYGRIKTDFSTQSAMQAARKTRTLSAVDFLPMVEADRWMFILASKKAMKTEVFELSSPARLIIDLKP